MRSIPLEIDIQEDLDALVDSISIVVARQTSVIRAIKYLGLAKDDLQEDFDMNDVEFRSIAQHLCEIAEGLGNEMVHEGRRMVRADARKNLANLCNPLPGPVSQTQDLAS